jgi:hypothetical protein
MDFAPKQKRLIASQQHVMCETIAGNTMEREAKDINNYIQTWRGVRVLTSRSYVITHYFSRRITGSPNDGISTHLDS